MRRLTVLAVFALAAALALPAAAARGDFAPKNLRITRTALAGVTPRMNFAQVKRQWGRLPIVSRPTILPPGTPPVSQTNIPPPVRLPPPQTATEYRGRGPGRSTARWGSYWSYGQSAAWAYYLGRRAGNQPFRYQVDLYYARQIGYEIRTAHGHGAGTPFRVFRRHWRNARRIDTQPGYTYLVANARRPGWRLAFLFASGQLKEAELVTLDFVEKCWVKRCRVYPEDRY